MRPVLIDEAHGSLGNGLWSRNLVGLITRAIPMLPNQPGWAQLAGLELRLLESPASLPAGKQDGEPVLALARRQTGRDGRFGRRRALLSHMPNPQMSGPCAGR